MLEFLKSNDALFLVMAALQISDTATGMMCVQKRETFSGKKLRTGILKKIGDWFFIAVSFLAAHVLVQLGGVLDMDFTQSRTLGWLVLATMLYKECRSVFDNLQCLGLSIPPVLSKALLLAEKEFDGVLALPSNRDAGINLQLNKSLEELDKTDVVHVRVKK